MNINSVLDISFDDDAGSDESAEPVTVEEATSFIRIDVTDDNVLVAQLITAARQQCENYLNISLVQKTVTAILQNDLGDIRLPACPFRELVSIKDMDDNDITDYKLNGLDFKWLCSPCKVKIIYTAGYDEIPDNFKTAILQQIAYLYENRGDEGKLSQLSPIVTVGLKPYRRVV